MTIESIRYMGLPNCIKLSNGIVELIATTDVGPRIAYYGKIGGRNMFGQCSSVVKTELGEWNPYGGHRLWVWPELFPATYAPDNEPIEHIVLGESVVLLRQPIDSARIQKEIQLTLSPSGSRVDLTQKITNHCLWPIEVAPWAITSFTGGAAIVPRVPFRSHDESVTVAQPLALYAYSDLQDPRLTIGSRYIILRANQLIPSPQKFGLRNKQEWCAYLLDDDLFVKRFSHDELASYPDYGVNNEIYVEGSYMEIELLGAKQVIYPGGSLVLSERWCLFKSVDAQEAEDQEHLHRVIAPLIETMS